MRLQKYEGDENMNGMDLNEKLKFFLENKTKIHVDLIDGTFLNGFLIKEVKDGVWQIHEDKLGPVFLFVKDINRLQQYRREE